MQPPKSRSFSMRRQDGAENSEKSKANLAKRLKSNADLQFKSADLPKTAARKKEGGHATRFHEDASQPHKRNLNVPQPKTGVSWNKREGYRKSGASKPKVAAFVRCAVTHEPIPLQSIPCASAMHLRGAHLTQGCFLSARDTQPREPWE